jgi:hypothetical protein
MKALLLLALLGLSACATAKPVIVSFTSPYHDDPFQGRTVWRLPAGSCYVEVWYQPGLFGTLLESGLVPCPRARGTR